MSDDIIIFSFHLKINAHPKDDFLIMTKNNFLRSVSVHVNTKLKNCEVFYEDSPVLSKKKVLKTLIFKTFC